MSSMLLSQRDVRHFQLEGQFGIGVQHVELDVVGVHDVRIGVVGGDAGLDGAGHQLQIAVGVALLGISRQRSDDHVLKTDGRGDIGGSSGSRRHGNNLTFSVRSVARPG